MSSLPPGEFLARLTANELPDPVDVTIIGLAKTDEKSSQVIQFSTSLNCGTWLPLPIEIVESVEHVKTVRCKDHSHPLVKIKLKQPDHSRQDLVFLLTLLSQLQTSLSRAVSAARKRTDAIFDPENCTDCKYVNTPLGV